jgi:sigma-54 dependent transcriptional regulator, acetoin dehydrogenase operon transcriptional activator AcoR
MTHAPAPRPPRHPAPGTLAPSPFFATVADRLAWARQRYFDEGQRPSGLVSEPVIQSWQRCLAAGLKPHQRPEFEPVTRSRVSAALARGHTLLQAAAPEIDQLDTLLAGTGCKLLLTDGQGVVLRASAGGAEARSPLELGARVGVWFAEHHLGSTAPSVVARSGRACTVSGGEHFFGALEQVHCAAAPIRNRDGAIAAVLDVSIEGRPFAFDAFALVRLFATAIENRYVAGQARERLLVRFALAPSLLGTAMEGLAVVGEDGGVSWVNAAGLALLEPPGGTPQPRHVEPLFGVQLQQLLQASGAQAPLPHRLPSGLGIWLAAVEPAGTGRAERDDGGTLAEAAAPPSLDDVHRRHIEQTLAECRGNISAAARRLGVSRGLLYRRLREWQGGGDLS